MAVCSGQAPLSSTTHYRQPVAGCIGVSAAADFSRPCTSAGDGSQRPISTSQRTASNAPNGVTRDQHLKAAARQSPQGGIFDGARQAARRSPRASVSDKSMGGVDHCVVALGSSEHGGQSRLCERMLLPVESGRVDAAFVFEGEHSKGAPDDAPRTAIDQFDDQIGRAHSLLREDGQAMACRISQHPVERRGRQAIEAVVMSDEESSTRKTHGDAVGASGVRLATLAEIPQGALPMGNSSLGLAARA